MRKACLLLLTLCLVFVGTRRADAQVLGYAVAGPAGFSGFFGSGNEGLHPAAGAEAVFRGVAGVAAEFGGIISGGSYLWVYSLNGVLHILPSRPGRTVSPFVTGGYTHMYNRDGGFDAWNAGAGVDLWAKKRAGARFEYRNHVRDDPRGTVKYWTVRAGVVLR